MIENLGLNLLFKTLYPTDIKNQAVKKNSQDLLGQFYIKYTERFFLGIEIVAVIKLKRSWVI